MYDTENSVLIRTNFTCPLDSTLPGRQVITDAGASLESHAGHDAITSSPERVASSLPSPRMQGVRSAQAASKEKSKQEKSKILLVEDDADILQVLCVFLKYAGFEVCGVSSGQEAIRVVPEFCPHLIVLDLMMQPVNGFEVLEWLRANQITPPLPVLMLTALTHLKDQVYGFEEGAIEYMTKPTQPSALVERISTILSLTVEQRTLLQRKRMDEQRRAVERLYAPQPDEFVY